MLFATDTIQVAMRDLADVVRMLHTNGKGLWSPDDVISIFDELTGKLISQSFQLSIMMY